MTDRNHDHDEHRQLLQTELCNALETVLATGEYCPGCVLAALALNDADNVTLGQMAATLGDMAADAGRLLDVVEHVELCQRLDDVHADLAELVDVGEDLSSRLTAIDRRLDDLAWQVEQLARTAKQP